MDNLEKRLLAILDSSKGERSVHSFLKKYPEIVRTAFSMAWNANIEVPEFCFGNDWRADFLLLSADSGHWIATFIELEPPNSRLYLNNGTPSKTLRVAQRQINDWKEWIRLHESYLREQFSKILTKAGIGAQTGGVHEKAGTEILDPRTVISFDFHIVIGRRHSLNAEEQFRRAREGVYWGGAEIATYDRLLSKAKMIDDYQQLLMNRNC